MIKIEALLEGKTKTRAFADALASLKGIGSELNKQIKQIDKLTAAWERATEQVMRYGDAVPLFADVPSSVGSRGRGGRGGGKGVRGGSGSSATNKPYDYMDSFRLWQKADRMQPGRYAAKRKEAYDKAFDLARQQMKQGLSVGYRNMATLLASSSVIAPPKLPSPPPTPASGSNSSSGSASQAGAAAAAKVSGGGRGWLRGVLSSRVGLTKQGVTFSPAVARLFAPLASMGPVGLAVSGALLALAAGAIAATSAIKSLASRAQSAAAVGGRSATSLQLIAEGLGLGDAKSVAGSIQNAIQSGPGAAYAASLGINPVGGPFGDMNYAAKAQKVLADIANSSSFEEARRKAEMAGTPEAAASYYLNASQKAYLRNNVDADPRSQAVGVQANFEYQRALNEVTYTKDLLMVELIKQIMPAVKAVAVVLEGLNRVLGISADEQTSKREQVQALRENTRELKKTREVLGGGQRAANAIPGSARGQHLNAGAREAIGAGVIA